MSVTQSIEGCLEGAIGEYGLPQSRLAHWLAALEPGFSKLRARAEAGDFPHFAILRETSDIEAAEKAFHQLISGARSLFVLGTGGSSLGGQTLAQLGGWCIPGDNGAPASEKRPRLRFYDNLDGLSFISGLDAVDLSTARFIVISKSGSTAETLAQMLTVFARLSAAGLGDRIASMFLAVSDPREDGKANGLRDLCEAYGIPVLDHPAAIGGRYSGLSIVGLLPLMARGLDPYAVRRGAQKVVDALIKATSPGDFAPALGAALGIGLAKDKGVTISVMMPYADRLERFAAWYVQLWAESLGKDGKGTTPLAAVGPVDQHSQLQLFIGGPRDKLFTVLTVGTAGRGPRIDATLAKVAGEEGIGGRTMGDLVAAQGRATAETLARNGCPVRTLHVERLDEAALGELLMHFMLETIIAAHLLGVDPFDQPAVEEGKVLAKKYLAGS